MDAARLPRSSARLIHALVFLSLLAPSIAHGQQPPPIGGLQLSLRELAPPVPPGGLAFRQQPPAAQRTRDSLKNGALIGAIVGAAALGGFGLFLCHALDDTGDPNCFPGILAVAAVGAGIGTAAGIGIDALLVRQPQPSLRIRIRLPN